MKEIRQKILEMFDSLGVPREIYPKDYWIETIEIGGRSLGLVGLASENGIGSAAKLSDVPWERAAWEYLERIAIGLSSSQTTSSDDRFVYSKSNGVSIHTNRKIAETSAHNELIERDRILRAWFGDPFNPVQIRLLDPTEWTDPDWIWLRQVLEPENDIFVCEFVDDQEPHIRVFGIFSFGPRTMPLVYGFGTTLKKAAEECIQRFSFLRGEEMPTISPAIETNPLSQQEYYLYPPHAERVRSWVLTGGRGERYLNECIKERTSEIVRWVDLTPKFLMGKAFVIQAISAQRLPLTFGSWHPSIQSHTPPDIAIHPIA